MKRFIWLVGLMALSSPACARDYSFVFHGHDIHIETARHCRSLSCVLVSVGDRHSRHDRDEEEVATVRKGAPAAAPPPAPAHAQPLPAPVQTAPVATRAPSVLPAAIAQPATQPVQVPVQAPIQAPAQAQPAPPPVQVPLAPMPAPALASAPSTLPAPLPAVAVEAPQSPLPPPPAGPPPAKAEQPAPPETPQAKPQVPARIEEAESDPDTPIGDWQTEGNTNLVRIESCGRALCGFVLDAATHTKGESILINMKPKSDTQWTGNVYSRASGNSYYGRMTLKDGKTLRVEACALGSFFCSGNNWTRIEQKPATTDDLISSHETVARVRS